MSASLRSVPNFSRHLRHAARSSCTPNSQTGSHPPSGVSEAHSSGINSKHAPRAPSPPSGGTGSDSHFIGQSFGHANGTRNFSRRDRPIFNAPSSATYNDTPPAEVSRHKVDSPSRIVHTDSERTVVDWLAKQRAYYGKQPSRINTGLCGTEGSDHPRSQPYSHEDPMCYSPLTASPTAISDSETLQSSVFDAGSPGLSPTVSSRATTLDSVASLSTDRDKRSDPSTKIDRWRKAYRQAADTAERGRGRPGTAHRVYEAFHPSKAVTMKQQPPPSSSRPDATPSAINDTEYPNSSRVDSRRVPKGQVKDRVAQRSTTTSSPVTASNSCLKRSAALKFIKPVGSSLSLQQNLPVASSESSSTVNSLTKRVITSTHNGSAGFEKIDELRAFWKQRAGKAAHQDDPTPTSSRLSALAGKYFNKEGSIQQHNGVNPYYDHTKISEFYPTVPVNERPISKWGSMKTWYTNMRGK